MDESKYVQKLSVANEVEIPNIPNCAEEHPEIPIIEVVSPLKKFGLLKPTDLYKVCDNQNQKVGAVEGLFDRPSLSILVGDSGLGKSPLAYQLGVSVAAGIPFLGMNTQQGTVVYADLENPLFGCREVLDSVALQFLKLSKAPESFLLWTPEHSRCDSFPLESICEDCEPDLLIVDSLRSYDPAAEQVKASGAVMKRLHAIAANHDVVMLFIHHTRKPDNAIPAPSLESDTRLLEWLNSASGHKAIVNQSDTRIGADVPKNPNAALVMRWHQRLTGEGGPLFLERVANENGEPIGYQPLQGLELLSDPSQREALCALPLDFTFTMAQRTYGKSDHPTTLFLKKCISFGLIKKHKAGGYTKLPAALKQ